MEYILNYIRTSKQQIKVTADTLEQASAIGMAEIRKIDKWYSDDIILDSIEPGNAKVPYPDEITEKNLLAKLAKNNFIYGKAITFADPKMELSDVTVERCFSGQLEVSVIKDNSVIFCNAGWDEGDQWLAKMVHEAIIMAACYDDLHSNKPYPKNVEPKGFEMYLRHVVEEFGIFPNSRCDLDIRQIVEIARIGAYAVKHLLAIIDNGSFKHYASLEDAGIKFEGQKEIDRFSKMTDETYGKWICAECSNGYTPGGWVNMLMSDGSVVSGNILKGVMWRPDLLEIQGVPSI